MHAGQTQRSREVAAVGEDPTKFNVLWVPSIQSEIGTITTVTEFSQCRSVDQSADKITLGAGQGVALGFHSNAKVGDRVPRASGASG